MDISWYGTDNQGVSWYGTDYQGVSLYGIDYQGVSWYGTDYQGVSWFRTELSDYWDRYKTDLLGWVYLDNRTGMSIYIYVYIYKDGYIRLNDLSLSQKHKFFNSYIFFIW